MLPRLSHDDGHKALRPASGQAAALPLTGPGLRRFFACLRAGVAGA